MSRVVVWFSCGAASAVAAKLALDEYGDRVEVVYCDTMATEHPDNQRFFDDIEQWLGISITRIRSDKYDTVDDVFEQTRYMAGIAGARCTAEMKKLPRLAYERDDDLHIFGLTADERDRIAKFRANNFDLDLDFILSRRWFTKDDCIRRLTREHIRLPMMYFLGFDHNNCLGCVKATSANYWNMTREHFPDVFDRRVRQSRELGVRLVRVRGERVFLDELPPDYLPAEPPENISCGPDCPVPDTLFDGDGL